VVLKIRKSKIKACMKQVNPFCVTRVQLKQTQTPSKSMKKSFLDTYIIIVAKSVVTRISLLAQVVSIRKYQKKIVQIKTTIVVSNTLEETCSIIVVNVAKAKTRPSLFSRSEKNK